jgi:hypothetical protein
LLGISYAVIFLVSCCRPEKVFPAPNILPPLLFFVRLLSSSAFVGFSRTACSCESEQVRLIFPLDSVMFSLVLGSLLF